MILAVPALRLVTKPFTSTVAIAVFDDDHTIARPVNTLLLTSRSTALPCEVAPATTLLLANVTLTEFTGTSVTVSVVLFATPSLVAVMLVVPAVCVVTKPLAFTVATAVFDDDHTIVRPVSTLLPTSRSTALACVVAPATTLVAVSDTVTEFTGTTVTVNRAKFVAPSLVAMMVAVPLANVVTNPLAFTVATAVFDYDQTTGRPVTTFLLASRSTALACDVAPTTTLVAVSETATLATGASVTVNVATPDFVSLVAVMLVVPALRLVTTPFSSTDATAGFDDDQAIARPVNTLLPASRSTALACVVTPATTLVAVNDTVTEFTGTCVTVSVVPFVTPSLVAVMIEVPGASACTMPDADTKATVEFELA